MSAQYKDLTRAVLGDVLICFTVTPACVHQEEPAKTVTDVSFGKFKLLPNPLQLRLRSSALSMCEICLFHHFEEI